MGLSPSARSLHLSAAGDLQTVLWPAKRQVFLPDAMSSGSCQACVVSSKEGLRHRRSQDQQRYRRTTERLNSSILKEERERGETARADRGARKGCLRVRLHAVHAAVHDGDGFAPRRQQRVGEVQRVGGRVPARADCDQYQYQRMLHSMSGSHHSKHAGGTQQEEEEQEMLTT